MNGMRVRFPRKPPSRRTSCQAPIFPVEFEEDLEYGREASSQELHKLEGKFTFTLERLSQFASKHRCARAESHFTCIRGIPWQIKIWKGSDESVSRDFYRYMRSKPVPLKPEFLYLDISVNCEPEELRKLKYAGWSCEASVTFKLLPQTAGVSSSQNIDPRNGRKRKRVWETSSAEPLNIRQFHHIFCNESQKRGFRYTWRELEELMDPAKGWYDPTTDSIRIEAVVKAEMPCGVGLDRQEQFLASIDSGYKFFESGDFTDCIIQFVDPQDSKQNKDFRVHKFVLASRSDVFCAMFSNKDTMESRESRVQIVGSTARAIHQMLQYLYAGQLPADFQREDAIELLKLADRYQIKPLALDCEEDLIGSLDLENVCHRLVLADRHNAHSLRIVCIQMIRDNMDAMKQQAEWAVLKKSSPDLVITVMEKCNSKNAQNGIDDEDN